VTFKHTYHRKVANEKHNLQIRTFRLKDQYNSPEILLHAAHAGLVGPWRRGTFRRWWCWPLVILLTAIAAGILVGLLVAWRNNTTWQPPLFKHGWLVVAGFLPQFLAFYLPATRRLFPDWLAAASLVVSQVILLAFCFLNRRLPGILLIIIGLGFNLIVILANGGFMPLPMETAAYLLPQESFSQLESSRRVAAGSKDVFLPMHDIIFPWLADRFYPPKGFPYQFVFSLGDVLIAAGTFWLLVKPMHPTKPIKEESHA
jgi:hypothetical protein